METTIDFNQTGSRNYEIAPAKTKTSSIDWKLAEKNRYGINMVVLALTLLPGSIAVPYAVNMGDWQLAAVVFPSIFTLILTISLAPMKWIVWAGAFALALSITLFVTGAVSGVI